MSQLCEVDSVGLRWQSSPMTFASPYREAYWLVIPGAVVCTLTETRLSAQLWRMRTNNKRRELRAMNISSIAGKAV